MKDSIEDMLTENSVWWEVMKQPPIKHISFRGISYQRKGVRKNRIIHNHTWDEPETSTPVEE